MSSNNEFHNKYDTQDHFPQGELEETCRLKGVAGFSVYN